jgi:hypothetical protein
MKPEQVLVANIVAALLLLTLVGLVRSQRASMCWPFTSLILFALTTNRMVVWWPELFYRQDFWYRKELANALLESIIALSLCNAAMQDFGRARRVATSLLVAIFAAAVVLGWSAADGAGYLQRLGVVTARVHTGAGWGFTVLLAAATWFRLPLDGFHRSVAIGFALYLSLYGALMSAVGWLGWAAYPYLAAFDPATFAASVGIWMRAAWAPHVSPIAAAARP